VETKDELPGAVAAIAMRSRESETGPNENRTELGRAANGGWIYQVSPRFDRIEPGEEIRVDVALVAVAEPDRVHEVSGIALATFVGDGTNLYLPPPVSVKPRVVWGTYSPDYKDERVVVVDLLDFSDDAVTPDRILYISGIDASQVETRRDPTAGTQLILRGDVADGLLKEEARTTLKGRIDTGEFFEMILRPKNSLKSSQKAEVFWKTPGKLPPELLSGSPNPFRNSTSILYEIPTEIEQEDGSVLRSGGPHDTSVKIYNVSGRLVSVLAEDRLFPGTYSIDWTAADDHGNAVASGVYYLRLQIDKKSITKRLIVLK
jgi:hypothetical protein